MLARELVASAEEASGVTTTRDALETVSRHMQTGSAVWGLLRASDAEVTGVAAPTPATGGGPTAPLGPSASAGVAGQRTHRLALARALLDKELLPHAGRDPSAKAVYIGCMARKLLLCSLGLADLDDRDSYVNKRVDTPGVLFANLFRQYYGKVVKDLKNMLQKEIHHGSWRATGKLINLIHKGNVYKLIKSTIIESGLKYGLSTGNWGVKSASNRQGVAQVLNRLTYNATLSHLRRISTPCEKQGKLIQPRKLHSTNWGIICPSETPEGTSVGLVKNLAMSTSITIASSAENLRDVFAQLGVNPLPSCGKDCVRLAREAIVSVNGETVGTHPDPASLHFNLREMKRSGEIGVHTSVAWNVVGNEICVYTDGGRCVRPLLIVDCAENGERATRLTPHVVELLRAGRLEWPDLVCGNVHEGVPSVVEYVDVEESDHCLIAMKPTDLTKPGKGNALPLRYTHCEIHPSLFLGVLASCIPFSDHNQAPRNTYQVIGRDCLHGCIGAPIELRNNNRLSHPPPPPKSHRARWASRLSVCTRPISCTATTR
jgi:DNA-directed RNA polymerase II subunit RPB2